MSNLAESFVANLIQLGNEGRTGQEAIVAAIQNVEDESDIALIEEALVQLEDVLEELGQAED